MEHNPNKLASKHTAGPWYVRNTGSSILVKHENEVVCSIYDLYLTEATADAHMISAAPEAIELLADILEQIDAINKLLKVDYFLEDKRKRAEAILKKAYNL